MIDGLGIGDVGVKVIDDRNQLQNDGVVIIGMTIDGKTREIVAPIQMYKQEVLFT